ncbi:MAG: GAF domain-containing protein, partial [Vicingaceae bacterium]
MIIPHIPANEKERLEALKSYHILDTRVEDEFDNLANLAAEICDAPLAFISLIDKERQWFKSKVNFETIELPRSESFCGHAILCPNEIMLIEDARKDERFKDNPAVTKKEEAVIFYAGVPILSAVKLPLGTLCVVDHKVKKLKDFQVRALKTLAKQIEKLLE